MALLIGLGLPILICALCARAIARHSGEITQGRLILRTALWFAVVKLGVLCLIYGTSIYSDVLAQIYQAFTVFLFFPEILLLPHLPGMRMASMLRWSLGLAGLIPFSSLLLGVVLVKIVASAKSRHGKNEQR